MRWRTDDEGSSTLISFLIATGVFAVAFTTVAYYAGEHITETEPGPGAYDAVAATAADALMGSPGTPAAWHTGPVADIQRWGLLKQGLASTIDGDKVVAAHGWGDAEYATAKRSLGLEDHEMRVRLYPDFRNSGGVADALKGYRVAYIGGSNAAIHDLESAALDDVVPLFTDAAGDADASDGLTAGDVWQDEKKVLRNHLAPRLWGFAGAQDTVQLTSPDSYWKVVEPDEWGDLRAFKKSDGTPIERVLTPSTFSAGSWKYGATIDGLNLATPKEDKILLVAFDLTGRTWASGDSFTVTLTHWVDGEQTDPVPLSDQQKDYGRIEYYCTSGCGVAGWQPGSLAAFGTGADVGQVDSFVTQTTSSLNNLWGKSGYLALSWYAWGESPPDFGQGWFISEIRVQVSDDGSTLLDWTNELDFDADDDGEMDTTNYDQIVVGSMTKQDDFSDGTGTDPTFEYALSRWVTAGGHVLATGNDNIDTGWIQELDQSGAATSVGGGLYQDRTDHQHSLLNNPFQLRYDSYNPALQTYKLKHPSDPTLDPFHPVVRRLEDPGGSKVDVALLWVPTGVWTSANEGVAVFTAFAPYRMGPEESENFYSNCLLYQRYYDLAVDFGRRVPTNTVVGSANRAVVIDAADYGLGTTQAELVVHVWR